MLKLGLFYIPKEKLGLCFLFVICSGFFLKEARSCEGMIFMLMDTSCPFAACVDLLLFL